MARALHYAMLKSVNTIGQPIYGWVNNRRLTSTGGLTQRRLPQVLFLALIASIGLMETLHGSPPEIAPLPAVMKSVFKIQYGVNSGAAFAIEVDDKQYLITAQHVVPGITKDSDVMLINSEVQRNIIKVTPILCENTNVDIIVLVPPSILTDAKRVPATQSGAVLGQDVFVFGFPLGYYTAVEKNIVPFVGKGMISAIDDRDKSAMKYFFHTTAAPGFSGGPIVFIAQDSNAPKILGVISGFDTVDYPVFNGAVDTGLRGKVNPGIMFGYSIDHAIAAIRKQPIGPLISAR